ncbi:MAG: hypothetical protein ISF22_06790 [Methanomassiliicoccus sp.]|nr:hypothetical protein [Methanomassiliicoccus sp.]
MRRCKATVNTSFYPKNALETKLEVTDHQLLHTMPMEESTERGAMLLARGIVYRYQIVYRKSGNKGILSEAFLSPC